MPLPTAAIGVLLDPLGRRIGRFCYTPNCIDDLVFEQRILGDMRHYRRPVLGHRGVVSDVTFSHHTESTESMEA